MDSSSRRKIAALLLGLSLAAPLASASVLRAPNEAAARVEAPSLLGWFDEVWQFLSSKLWSKCGASPDPDGACKSQPHSSGSTDAGSSAGPKCGGSPDPNGACKNLPPSNGSSSSTSDAGGSADPNG